MWQNEAFGSVSSRHVIALWQLCDKVVLARFAMETPVVRGVIRSKAGCAVADVLVRDSEWLSGMSPLVSESVA